MDERNVTVMNIWSFAGPIWMTIVGFVMVGVMGTMGPADGAALGIIGSLLICGAIALFIVIGMRNSKIKKMLSRQQFKTACTKCYKPFEYTGIQVIRHKRWPYGYIDCPHCRTHNGHVISNLVEMKP